MRWAARACIRNVYAPLLEADLVVLDDLFLARRISDVAGELLQMLVHQRYKLRRSIVVTSNRIVQDWGKYLSDNTMATTILDRLMHRLASARIRRQELSPQRGRNQICSKHINKLIIYPSCLGDFGWPKVGDFEVANGAYQTRCGLQAHIVAG